jgi:hypothetical protein
MTEGALPALVRRDRAVVLSGLAAVVVLAWAYLLFGAGVHAVWDLLQDRRVLVACFSTSHSLGLQRMSLRYPPASVPVRCPVVVATPAMSRPVGSWSIGPALRGQDQATGEGMRSALRSGIAPGGQPCSVSTVVTANAEWRGWPPRVARGSAFHAAIAASVNQWSSCRAEARRCHTAQFVHADKRPIRAIWPCLDAAESPTPITPILPDTRPSVPRVASRSAGEPFQNRTDRLLPNPDISSATDRVDRKIRHHVW